MIWSTDPGRLAELGRPPPSSARVMGPPEVGVERVAAPARSLWRRTGGAVRCGAKGRRFSGRAKGGTAMEVVRGGKGKAEKDPERGFRNRWVGEKPVPRPRRCGDGQFSIRARRRRGGPEPPRHL